MRPVTRNAVIAMVVIVGLLLALGALPSLLKSGDPYHLTATPIAADQPDANQHAVNASKLSVHAYPYTWAALGNASATAAGRSSPYWRGPIGLKEAFTHSPFDELGGLRARYGNATAGDAAFVTLDGQRYRLAIRGG